MIYYVFHYIEHKYLYTLIHKKHHEIQDTCIFLGAYLDIIDNLVPSLPIFIVVYIMKFSTICKYIYFSYNLIQILGSHFIYSYGNKKIFCFHNYHHYNPRCNYSFGIFGTFAIMDRLCGTYIDVTKINLAV